MKHHIKDIYGAKINASDGDIGHVQDFYFDDSTWAVRYLIADTGTWLMDREILLSPHSIDRVDVEDGLVLLDITRQQVENSPSAASDRPVSRQYEMEYYRYYGYPNYWGGDGLWGFSDYPGIYPASVPEWNIASDHSQDDPNLRSTRSVTGYDIEATDGTIGHVSGFLLDDSNWAIGDIVVEARHWYSGKEILILPESVERISYAESKVFVNLSKADIQRAAEHTVAALATHVF
jgi:uncharacterized protein YrrD